MKDGKKCLSGLIGTWGKHQVLGVRFQVSGVGCQETYSRTAGILPAWGAGDKGARG